MKKSFLAILMACLMVFTNLSFVFAEGEATKIELLAKENYDTSEGLGMSSGKAKFDKVGDFVLFEVTDAKAGGYGVLFYGGTNKDGVKVKVYVGTSLDSLSEVLTGDVVNNVSTLKSAQSTFGSITLPEGDFFVKVELSEGSCRFEKLELVPIVAFELSSVKVNGGEESLETDDVILRSTSIIKVSFTASVDKNTVNEETVAFTANGETVEATINKGDNYFEIIPVSTLDYETDYKLTVNGVKNSLGDTTIENFEMTLKTSTKENDEGTGTVEDGEISISARNVSFAGKLIDGNGIGLKGREVKVYFEEGTEPVLTVLTEKDGKFSFNHSIPKNSPSGDYSYTVVGEYMTEGEAYTVNYDADAIKALLTQEFNVSQHNAELSKPQNETMIPNAEGQFVSFNGFPKDEQVFDVNIPEEGSYNIFMKGGCGAGMKLYVSYLPNGKDALVDENWILINEFESVSTGGNNVFAYQKAGACDFEEGPVKIKIGILSTDMHFMGIKLEYAEPEFAEGKSIADYEKLSLSAKMLSGSGKPMSDKAYEIYLKNPEGIISDEPIKTGVTDENGLVIADITMKETDSCGLYYFVIKSEEIPVDCEVPVNYISKDKENEIIGSVSDAKDLETIKEILENNQVNLTIDLENDLAELSENEVFAHIKDAEVKNIEEFKDAYKSAIVLEKINQATAKDEVSAVISDEEALDSLGIDKFKVSLLDDTSKEMLATELEKLDRIEKLADAPETLNSQVDNVLCIQYEKNVVSSLAENVSVEAGSGAEISLSISEKISDVKKMVFTITADKEMLANASVYAQNCTYTVADNTMIITFEKTTGFNNISDFGSVYLSTKKEAGTFDVKLSADITYSIVVQTDSGNVPVELSNVMNEKTVTVTTTKKSGSSSSSSSDRPTSSTATGVSRTPSSSGTPSVDAPVVTPDVPSQNEKFAFSDLSVAEWAKESVEYLLEKGIVSESEDKKFNPNTDVKREEFIKMVVLASDIYNENATCEFGDVASDSWYYRYVASAFDKGLITGREGNLFGSGDYITRQEMSAIIYRAYKDKLGALESDKFADDDLIADYAKEAVYALKGQNVINGMGDNLFAPNAFVTRAMAAKVLAGLLK